MSKKLLVLGLSIIMFGMVGCKDKETAIEKQERLTQEIEGRREKIKELENKKEKLEGLLEEYESLGGR